MLPFFYHHISKGCDFYLLLQSLVKYEFNCKDENTYLIGDFNFDVNENNELTKYLSRLNFHQIVKRATHLDGHLLDHVYIQKTRSNQVEVKHHHVYYSDHDAILVKQKNPSLP